MSDKRSVATDALATLGTIIDETAKRDAIHLAVIPMEGYDEILLRSLAVSKLYLKTIERAGDADYITFHSQASSGAIPAEFWDHAEVVLGFKINHRPTWFECDC